MSTPDTFTYEARVIPRDLVPGDKIQRRPETPFGPGAPVWCTVDRVEKIKNVRGTAYRIHLAERGAIPSVLRSTAAYRHLRPFVLYPTMKVTVERTASAKGLIGTVTPRSDA